MLQVYSVRQTSELMTPDFQGFDVSSSLILKVQMNLLLKWCSDSCILFHIRTLLMMISSDHGYMFV